MVRVTAVDDRKSRRRTLSGSQPDAGAIQVT
jgi:hypothetical protein